jgi:anaerobic ribonucleoside-triphosphate reductase activating protein
MNYIKLVAQSTHSGPGIRVVLYVSGCRNCCPGCQNPETWCFAAGEAFTLEVEQHIFNLLDKPYIAGLTLCGGEPMEEENQVGLINLLASVKGKFPDKSIWCYTGYEWSDLMIGGKKNIGITLALLGYIDVLITGRYIESLRDITNNNLYRGSRNQRLVDVQESLAMSGFMVLVPDISNNNYKKVEEYIDEYGCLG